MPAPTTSTSTLGRRRFGGHRTADCTDRLVIRDVTVAIVDQKRSALPVPYRDGGPGPGAQGALLRPRLLRDGGRAAVAAGLADGVPARGDPAAARLRRVRDPRPVDHRAAHRRPGRARVPERLPPSRRQGRRGSRDVRARVHVPVPRMVLRPRRQEHRRPAATDVRRAQPAARRHRPRAGAVRGVGRVRVDQPRRRRAAVAAVHRAGRHDPRRVEGRVAADRVVVRVPSPGELEARRSRRSSRCTTWWRRIRSSSSRDAVSRRARRIVRPARVRRRGASTTCAR